MIRFLYFIPPLLLTLLLFLNGCEKDFSPLTGEVYTSHDFTWEIDTLYNPEALQVLMRSIWGTDENNVWAVGHSDVYKYNIWHWDGSSWENIPLVFWGHPHSFSGIYGFSEDDVWAVGDDWRNYPNPRREDFIIHYDGSEWELINDVDAPRCYSVWGTSSDNLFVGCDSGIILNYDGKEWQKQHTGTRAQIGSIWGRSGSEVYAMGTHFDNVQPLDTTFFYFFKYNGIDWEIVDQDIHFPFSPDLKFGNRIWGDIYGDIYSVGVDGMYKLTGNSWRHIINDKTLFSVGGNAGNDFFIGGHGYYLAHYNGLSWKEYDFFYSDRLDYIYNFWSNKNHVFILTQIGFQSFVLRGTRKN